MADHQRLSYQGRITPPPAADRLIVIICLGAFLFALWPITHRYKGLTGDAALYAVQALAKIHPNLAGDLFLQNNSQDNYTVFPWLYAWCIRLLGIRDASVALFVTFKVWFFAAVWALTHQLFDRRSAFLSTVVVMIVAGSYGGYSVFNYSEDWLTARTLAEPMVITAIWLYFWNLRRWAFLTAIAAFFVHPLMTMPGLILLFLLRLSFTLGARIVLLGVITSLVAALIASAQPSSLGVLSIMDAKWLEIVRERSVFLFPQLWPARDWEANALPFLSLTISAVVTHDPKIRKLSAAVALVGASGLLVAIIAATIGPVAILLQGQAWRWVWITRFAALIFLAPTLLELTRESKCGLLCALLTVWSWIFVPIEGLACMTMVLFLRAIDHRVTIRGARYLRWIATTLAGVLVGRVITQAWLVVSSAAPHSDLEPALVNTARSIFGFGLIPMALAWSLIYWLENTTSRAVPKIALITLLICGASLFPCALRDHTRVGEAEQIAGFSDWRRMIAPNETVFVVPAHNSAAFAWFILQRPSYLTVDQSAGVVFSRATALEVSRRSEVLTPLMDPDWKLLSEKASSSPSTASSVKNEHRALTRGSLIEICKDPSLNFVVARENLGFEPVIHAPDGDWKNWNLYDCRRIPSDAATF